MMLADQRPPNRLLQSLPAADFEALQPHLQIVELNRESLLVEAGAALTHVFLPHSGIVSLVVSLSEGQAVEVAMIGRDGIVGAAEALGDAITLTGAVVLCPGTASVLPIADFRMLAGKNVAFRNLLVRHEQALLAQAEQSAACNASHTVEERLACRLLRAHDLWDGPTLPMTQELLARMIGVQRNAVSIVAHALQRARVLSYSRGHIEINDMDGLRETSCECYRSIKARQEKLLK
jgi:CRP-like cAMP-binding protein